MEHARGGVSRRRIRVAEVECDDGLTIPCETAIVAIGQLRLRELLQQVVGIQLAGSGLLTVDPATGQTGNPKYFAAAIA